MILKLVCCMNRKDLYDYIEENLNVLAYRVETRGKLNILDLHLHSENFYRDFLNLLYGWNLENLNQVCQNIEAIDLIDNQNKIVVQISSTNTKQKIESSLSKGSMINYIGWTFKFVSITHSSTDLRTKIFKNPYGLIFSPQNDIFDISLILRKINDLTIDKLQEIETFIRKELGNNVTTKIIESDLVHIIKLLAQEDWSNLEKIKLDSDFQIQTKIDYNNLIKSTSVIKEYNIWQNSVSRIYSAFDKEGCNKSLFVLQKIRTFYLEHCHELKGDSLFNAVRDDVKAEVKKHATSKELTEESIDICSDIIVVDAFMRCKIFENPGGYKYVTT